LENNTIKSTAQTRWLIVANPASGGGKVRKRWTEIERKLTENDVTFTAHFTKKRGDATEIVKNALHMVRTLHQAESMTEGSLNIIGLGGDGTLNEIINGIFPSSRAASVSRCLPQAQAMIGSKCTTFLPIWMLLSKC
jgi:diacylglycerol kinase family enzyme